MEFGLSLGVVTSVTMPTPVSLHARQMGDEGFEPPTPCV